MSQQLTLTYRLIYQIVNLLKSLQKKYFDFKARKMNYSRLAAAVSGILTKCAYRQRQDEKESRHRKMHLISFMRSKVAGIFKVFDLCGCDFFNISAVN